MKTTDLNSPFSPFKVASFICLPEAKEINDHEFLIPGLVTVVDVVVMFLELILLLSNYDNSNGVYLIKEITDSLVNRVCREE